MDSPRNFNAKAGLLFAAVFMKLNVAALERSGSVITVGNFQAEGIIGAWLSVVGYDTFEREGFFAVNCCQPFNTASDVVNCGVARDACAF